MEFPRDEKVERIGSQPNRIPQPQCHANSILPFAVPKLRHSMTAQTLRL
jgi:hypothetical protein